MSDSTTFSSSAENYPSSSQNYPSSSQNYPSSSQNYSSSSQNYSSSSQNFSASLLYALAELQMSHLGLKDEQERAMRAILEGNDVIMLLPTGFGKSIYYQALPFLFNHKLGLAVTQRRAVLVVSPLIALMIDQVRSLRERSVEAVVISSGSRETSAVDKEFLAAEENMKSASIIFSSPEALAYTKWRQVLEHPSVSSGVCAIVIDEAHYVSK